MKLTVDFKPFRQSLPISSLEVGRDFDLASIKKIIDDKTNWTPELAEREIDNLPLATPTAIRYLLPIMLDLALKHPDSGMLLEKAIIFLSPQDRPNPAFYRSHFEFFEPELCAAIHLFLDQIADDHPNKNISNIATGSLTFWSEMSGNAK